MRHAVLTLVLASLSLGLQAAPKRTAKKASSRPADGSVHVIKKGETAASVARANGLGVTVGLLVLYDMLKAVSHGMVIGPVRLLRKEGGRRGTLTMPWEDCPWSPGPSEG